jgi:hypothetical protein
MFLPSEGAKARPGLVKVVTAIQCLLAVAFAGTGAILLVPCRPQDELEAFAGAALMDMPPALAVVLLGIGVIAILGAYGIWKGWTWSWWVSLLIDLGILSGSVFQTYQIDASGFGHVRHLAAVIALSVSTVFLLSATVRKFCWGT